MKTRNLTQIRARNDPINCGYMAIHFAISKTNIGIQDVISP